MIGLVAFVLARLAPAASSCVRGRRGGPARTVATRLTLRPNGIVTGAAPIDLPADGGAAVLMLHGFGDTPQTLEYLAQAIHAQGWTRASAAAAGSWANARPTSPRVARTTGSSSRARSGVAPVALRDGVGNRAVHGGVARDDPRSRNARHGRARVARAVPQHADAAASCRSLSSRPRRAVPVSSRRRRAVDSRPGRSRSQSRLRFHDTAPRVRAPRIVERARTAAPKVSVPTLVVQSRQDHRIPADAAERAFALFTATERRCVWTEGNGHIITVDYGRNAIFAAVANWLSTHAPRGREERSVG